MPSLAELSLLFVVGLGAAFVGWVACSDFRIAYDAQQRGIGRGVFAIIGRVPFPEGGSWAFIRTRLSFLASGSTDSRAIRVSRKSANPGRDTLGIRFAESALRGNPYPLIRESRGIRFDVAVNPQIAQITVASSGGPTTHF